jgi:P27 family predicted phage terminase small subunit
MIRGTKPDPSAVRRLRGNPGKRAMNQQEPDPPRTAMRLAPPLELGTDSVALDYWDELVPVLARIRQITDVDRAALIALCVQWSRYIEATKALQQRDEQGRSKMLIKLDNGVYQQHPYIAIANKSLVLCTRLWAELGLTPSSRSRVQTVPMAHDDDPFAEFDEPHEPRVVKRRGETRPN